MQSITTWIFNPDEPFQLARRFADLEGTAFLFSGTTLDSAQSSYLCLFPKKKIICKAYSNCWEELKAKIGEFDSNGLSIPQWVGYIGYEMGCFADPDKSIFCFKSLIPDCVFYAPSVVIHFDHLLKQATLYGSNSSISLDRQPRIFKKSNSWKVDFVSDTLHSYSKKIEVAKEWILDGEIYQVNLSQEIHLTGRSDPFDLFHKITHVNPAPFSAFIQCGKFSIVSSSPERFLQKKNESIETRPIKGTAPRGKTILEDNQFRHSLMTSEKERAELLMITDLMRSDLGKIIQLDSLETKEIWRCESYTNVFHLLSVIQGKVDRNKNSVELIRELFPGGSVTGCPKLKAMEAIATLEQRSRGIYTGSIGYFAANGDFDFNIAIRTLIVHPDHIQLQLGGAIVIDSDPAREFEETLHKGRALFSILGNSDYDCFL